MNRLKAVYRSWAIPCAGKLVYSPQHRAEWLGKISELGVRRRAEFYYQQLDALRALRQQVRRDLLEESKKHQAWKRLCQIPSIGPIRAAVLLGTLQTPHRFRSKRQLWAFGGLGIETYSSADHRYVEGQLQRSKEARIDSRAEPKLQSRSEEFIQGCGDHRLDQAQSVARVLRGPAGQGDAGGDGAPDLGSENCHDRVDRMEERSVLRRPISETTNSLSVSDRVCPSLDFFWR